MGRTDNTARPKANLIEADDVIVVIISQVTIEANVNEQVIEYDATKHIYKNKNAFVSYTKLK